MIFINCFPKFCSYNSRNFSFVIHVGTFGRTQRREYLDNILTHTHITSYLNTDLTKPNNCWRSLVFVGAVLSEVMNPDELHFHPITDSDECAIHEKTELGDQHVTLWSESWIDKGIVTWPMRARRTRVRKTCHVWSLSEAEMRVSVNAALLKCSALWWTAADPAALVTGCQEPVHPAYKSGQQAGEWVGGVGHWCGCQGDGGVGWWAEGSRQQQLSRRTGVTGCFQQQWHLPSATVCQSHTLSLSAETALIYCYEIL